MNKAEFDRFADEYTVSHSKVLGPSGEAPEYFSEYKIADIRNELKLESMPEQILDFGCGVGNSIPFVRHYFPDSRLSCLDVSEKSLEIAESRFPGLATQIQFDGKKIPLHDNSVDLVFAACVFHHIDLKEHAGLLKEILRILKPNGYFFVFEHNPLNPLTVRAVNMCEFDENAVLISGQSMAKEFRAAGFDRLKLKFRIFFPNALKFLRPIEPYLSKLPFGAQYYVVGRKNSK